MFSFSDKTEVKNSRALAIVSLISFRNSIVAGTVKVTTKISLTENLSSTIIRKKSIVILYVFPVPALASMRFAPDNGTEHTSKFSMIKTPP
ncbi:MAG: hypothetical protein BWY23_02752 [Spirochaetes bacterium ADurb.Bin218]|nr:MAG: hypothetical protein BWY23_02752 [Spirochaetes bacterium ADurb.Bin218]